MTTEQILLNKWRALPLNKQQAVIDFVEFLVSKQHTTAEVKVEQEANSSLGERLQKIREEIVASGEPLLNWEGIEREVLERRGGYQEQE